MSITNSIASTPAQPFTASVPWLETQAEVTACRYEFARMNSLSLGIATRSDQFRISFSYYAHAKTFCDEFTSPVATGTGESFPVFYNPLNPKQNSRSEAAPTSRVPPLSLWRCRVHRHLAVISRYDGGLPIRRQLRETPRTLRLNEAFSIGRQPFQQPD